MGQHKVPVLLDVGICCSTYRPKDQAIAISNTFSYNNTFQELFLHCAHKSFEIMFDEIHHDVDLVHVATNNYLLGTNRRETTII